METTSKSFKKNNFQTLQEEDSDLMNKPKSKRKLNAPSRHPDYSEAYSCCGTSYSYYSFYDNDYENVHVLAIKKTGYSTEGYSTYAYYYYYDAYFHPDYSDYYFVNGEAWYYSSIELDDYVTVWVTYTLNYYYSYEDFYGYYDYGSYDYRVQ